MKIIRLVVKNVETGEVTEELYHCEKPREAYLHALLHAIAKGRDIMVAYGGYTAKGISVYEEPQSWYCLVSGSVTPVILT